MSDKVNELVERVFKILDREYIGDDDKDASNKHHRQTIKQILSDKDLAMKGERGFIYLAEAIKEIDNG